VNGGSDIGATGFCGPCVCLGVFLLLYYKVLVSGIAGGWGCVKLVWWVVSRGECVGGRGSVMTGWGG
jgi:hypothetical protein